MYVKHRQLGVGNVRDLWKPPCFLGFSNLVVETVMKIEKKVVYPKCTFRMPSNADFPLIFFHLINIFSFHFSLFSIEDKSENSMCQAYILSF